MNRFRRKASVLFLLFMIMVGQTQSAKANHTFNVNESAEITLSGTGPFVIIREDGGYQVSINENTLTIPAQGPVYVVNIENPEEDILSCGMMTEVKGSDGQTQTVTAWYDGDEWEPYTEENCPGEDCCPNDIRGMRGSVSPIHCGYHTWHNQLIIKDDMKYTETLHWYRLGMGLSCGNCQGGDASDACLSWNCTDFGAEGDVTSGCCSDCPVNYIAGSRQAWIRLCQ